MSREMLQPMRITRGAMLGMAAALAAFVWTACSDDSGGTADASRDSGADLATDTTVSDSPIDAAGADGSGADGPRSDTGGAETASEAASDTGSELGSDTGSGDSVAACVAKMGSCAAGQECCAGLRCCRGVPVAAGAEFCSDICPMR